MSFNNLTAIQNQTFHNIWPNGNPTLPGPSIPPAPDEAAPFQLFYPNQDTSLLFNEELKQVYEAITDVALGYFFSSKMNKSDFCSNHPVDSSFSKSTSKLFNQLANNFFQIAIPHHLIHFVVFPASGASIDPWQELLANPTDDAVISEILEKIPTDQITIDQLLSLLKKGVGPHIIEKLLVKIGDLKEVLNLDQCNQLILLVVEQYAIIGPNEFLINIIKKLVESGADVNTAQSDSGSTLLHIALNSPPINLQLLQTLIELRANPNLANNNGETVLALAAKKIKNQKLLLTFLRHAQQFPNLMDEDALTVLEAIADIVSMYFPGTEVIRYLKDEGVSLRYLALFDAQSLVTSVWFIETIREIGNLEELCNVVLNPSNNTIFHLIFQHMLPYKPVELLQLLLRDLKDRSILNLPNAAGATPLHLTAVTASAEIIELLIENGANPQQMNNEEMTPLQLALAVDRDQAVIQALSRRPPNNP